MSKLPFKVVAVDMDGTFMRDDQTFDHQRFNRILNQLRADGAHLLFQVVDLTPDCEKTLQDF